MTPLPLARKRLGTAPCPVRCGALAACGPNPQPQSNRRCAMKAPLRTKSIGTKVSEEEFAALEERARAGGHDALGMGAGGVAGRAGVELPDDDAALAGRVTLAEVLALRTLFLNLQFRQAQGPMTEAEMRGLIERADAVKGERARERIEAARSQARKQAGVPAEKPEAGEPQAEEG